MPFAARRIKMLFIHATVVTLGEDCRVLEDHAVLARDGVIAEIGTSKELEAKYPDERVIDVKGRLLMPGFICMHTHFYGMYSRGMALHDDPPHTFLEVLERLWWRLDRALDADAVRHSANVLLCAAIRAGTTCLFDHHASPSALANSLDIEKECIDKAGIRASLCYEVTDRNGEAEALAGIQENVRFLRAAHEAHNPKIHAMFGLHAALTLSEETLNKCKEEADKLGFPVGFHIHVCEGGDDNRHSKELGDETTVQRLARHGIAGPNSIFAHCVDVSDADIELIKETKTNVVHNPESNMNNAVGTARIQTMLDKGVLVGMGTDGMTADMVQEHKAAYLIHKLQSKNPQAFSVEAFNLLFRNNAIIANKLFGTMGCPELGRIGVGCAADLVVVDYIPPTPMTAGSLPWHVMFGLVPGMVKTVVCGGEVLMEEGKILVLDEARIMEEARLHAPAVWEKIPEIVAADKASKK